MGQFKNCIRRTCPFPYDVELKNLVCNVRWTMKQTNTSAVDVYEAIGSPEIFRLKYGWILNADQNSFKMPLTALCSEDNFRSMDYQKECCDTKVTAENKHQSCWSSQMPQPLSSDLLITDNQKMSHQTSLSWIDNLTNMSFSDLLLEASKNSHTAGGNPLPVERNSYPSQFPFSCDSFDAAIAAHIASNQASTLPTYVPRSSILDVDETCHAFPVPKFSSSSKETTLPTEAEVQTQDPACQSTANLQPHSQEQLNHVDDLCNEEPTKNLQLDMQGLPNDASSLGLTGISWSDSMGMLEFGVSSSRPYISSDSINISNLITSSLDAFQNCSFFGRDNTIESK
ncbi:TSL-kinase interacting protein 1 [Acorus calamus]|uniref:TSL-kinase interacting protein 1 n=1 Tax=Acorus calamus TaxID=4465 RepID=A0AAV9DWM1_ACOCL|nr:TSL-kinase interacting protein 1 [Acorus calamus]